MKYTEAQKKAIKKKEAEKKYIPKITMKDGYYIVESKMNEKL